MPRIPSLRKLRQEDHEFEASLCNIARLSLKKSHKIMKETSFLDGLLLAY
jgi:hypothetical protein